jgi:hypothetical protein
MLLLFYSWNKTWALSAVAHKCFHHTRMLIEQKALLTIDEKMRTRRVSAADENHQKNSLVICKFHADVREFFPSWTTCCFMLSQFSLIHSHCSHSSSSCEPASQHIPQVNFLEDKHEIMCGMCTLKISNHNFRKTNIFHLKWGELVTKRLKIFTFIIIWWGLKWRTVEIRIKMSAQIHIKSARWQQNHFSFKIKALHDLNLCFIELMTSDVT